MAEAMHLTLRDVRVMVRVMVVDDNKEVGDLYGEALMAAGFEVDVFCDGIQALNNCVRVRYALVVLDIKMPDIDGLAFMQMLRAQRPLMPYIFISGQAAPGNTRIVQNADAFVLKIDGPRKLVSTVIDVLANKGDNAGTSQSNCAV